MDNSILLASSLAALHAAPIVNPIIAAEIKTAEIISIKSFSEISSEHPERTLFLLDADDTAIDFPYSLGSSAFRRWIRVEAQKIDNSRNWHDVVTHYLSEHYPTVSVEPVIPEIIENWKLKNFVVVGLTARERQRWYDTNWPNVDEMTHQQFQKANIQFDQNGMQNHYPYLALTSEYYKATFYANTDLKGDFFKPLIENAPEEACPVKVVFVDDKEAQVQSMLNALTELGIPCECYHYTATFAKTKAFEPIVAAIQLYYFMAESNILTDQEAKALASSQSDKDVVWYLTESLKLFPKSN